MKRSSLKRNIIVALIIILILFVIYLLIMISGPKSTSEKVDFKIEKGSYVYSVGKKLQKEGLIKNYSIYKIYVKLTGVNEYKSGTYVLDKKYSMPKIVSILKSGKYKNEDVKVTFKEGRTITSIAKEVSKKTSITEEEFLSTVSDEAYITSLINKYWFLTDELKNKDIYYALEGYLYPETYYFNKDTNATTIIETMLNQTDKVFTKYKNEFQNSGYSINEIVTLASIIEKEAIYDKDKGKIAGVFINRLNKKMPLGSDVTTYYALKVELGSRELTSKEFNTYNPYNTRGPQMAGKLPVGPIANFSISSLEAALRPEETDYLYFVADNKGDTHFTKTYEEHNKVIRELKSTGRWIQL